MAKKKLPGRVSPRTPALSDAAEQRNIGGWEQWIPTPVLSGVTVTPETALNLTAVYACVEVIASTFASLPFFVYDRLPDGGRVPNFDDPVYELLQFEPNSELDAFNFWQSIVAHAVLYGNGMAEISRDPQGRPLGLHLLDPRTTSVKRHPSGALVYTGTSEESNGSERPFTLLAENVLHIKSIGYSGLVGYSPITLARESIGNLMAAEKTGSAALGQSSNPTGLIKVPGEVDDQARKNLREGWNKLHQGPYNASKVAILEQGAEFVPFTISLEDLQYLESRKFGVIEICRLFGVPPHKVGSMEQATFSNIEEQNIDFYQGTMRRWVVRVESEVNRKLFTRWERRTKVAQVSMNAVLRGNSESQAKRLTALFAMGALSVNDICREAGLNPIGPEGDLRYVSANLQTLGSLASVDPNELPSDPDKLTAPDPFATEPTEANQPGPEADSEATEAVRAVLRETLGRAVRKEVEAVRRASKRPDFRSSWLPSFYSEHRAFLSKTLAATVQAYSTVSKRAVDLDGLVDGLVDQSLGQLSEAEDIEPLLSQWEESKASSCIDRI